MTKDYFQRSITMAFNHQSLNNDFLEYIKTNVVAKNEATAYNVQIVTDEVAEGESYWQVIGVYHLKPDENKGNHHVYFEALDENGVRVTNPIAWADWTWKDRRPEEQISPIPLDKPANETAGNVALNRTSQIVSVWMKGQSSEATDKSDCVENLRTDHPDEAGSDGSLGNSIGHHSFYVVFQKAIKGTTVSADGIIKGRVKKGKGYVVRLYQNKKQIAKQKLKKNGWFKFEGLAPGSYNLQVVPPVINRKSIILNADNKVKNIIINPKK